MYTYQTKIHLHHTDAAGILFFAHQLELMHDAYEAMFETAGFGFYQMLNHEEFFLPIVHAEADYKSPLFVGDLVEIRVSVESIGSTSFTLSYVLLKPDQSVVGTGKTVHVSIDKAKRTKITLPPALREKIRMLAGNG